MIHALAFVHPNAKLGNGVVVEPFATVEDGVVIGDNCWIGQHAVVMRGTTMGENCKVFPGAIIGSTPQDLKYNGEATTLEIGKNVTIREYCTINIGTTANNTTIIGDNSLLMAYVHVAHDCIIADNCVLANNVTLAGHIEIGEHARIGGMVAIHQFVKIGKHVMISGGSLVGKDVPPYVKAARYPLSYVGINSIGLRRRGFESCSIHHIQDIYRILFVKDYNTTQAVQWIEANIDATEERDTILEFIRESDRGIIRGARLNGKK